ncbi:hypothetical protein QFZ37_003549 [Chryseobacterium ginsenosidimutans]|nr:hypothetical protein [Chryseobacterium ginsenosidimutans]
MLRLLVYNEFLIYIIMKNINIHNGIILIPDFNGFTEFVFNTKLYTGQYIVTQLLSTLIDANREYFEISEIEGDAILFYRYDANPSYQKISRILRNMQNAFNEKVKELSELLNTSIDLSLSLSSLTVGFRNIKLVILKNCTVRRWSKLINC